VSGSPALYTEIIAAISAIIVALIGLIKVYAKSLSAKNKIDATTVLLDSQVIYDCIDEIVMKTSVKRCLIFMTHNDKEVIKPSSKLYTSCLYERYEFPFASVKREYQNFPLDISYLKMLTSLMISERVDFIVSRMATSLLKDIYVLEGVKYSKVIYLFDKDRKKIWYMSVATDEDIEVFSKVDYAVIMKNVNNIASIIIKYEK